MGVSIGVTVIGTAFSMLITSLMAYALARKDLDGRKVVNFLVVFTMLFHGGMIPTFLVVKELGLIDSYAALILPSAISAFNMIILKNFFKTSLRASRNLPKLTDAMTSEFYSGLYCPYLCRP